MSFVREPLFSRPSNNAFWEVLPHQSIIANWRFALDEIIGVSGKLFGIRRSNLNSTSEPETVLDPISVVLVTVQYYFGSAIRPLSTLIISIIYYFKGRLTFGKVSKKTHKTSRPLLFLFELCCWCSSQRRCPYNKKTFLGLQAHLFNYFLNCFRELFRCVPVCGTSFYLREVVEGGINERPRPSWYYTCDLT